MCAKMLKIRRAKFQNTLSVMVMLLMAIMPFKATTQHQSKHQLPVRIEATILGKIISYDQSLASRVRDDNTIHIAVLSGAKNLKPDKRTDELYHTLNSIGSKLVPGHKVTAHRIAYTNAAFVQKSIAAQYISIIYVGAGLENNLDEIIRMSRAQKILTATSGLQPVEKGISVGIYLEDSKPRMVINVHASKQEGSIFPSSLLRLSRVIR